MSIEEAETEMKGCSGNELYEHEWVITKEIYKSRGNGENRLF